MDVMDQVISSERPLVGSDNRLRAFFALLQVHYTPYIPPVNTSRVTDQMIKSTTKIRRTLVVRMYYLLNFDLICSYSNKGSNAINASIVLIARYISLSKYEGFQPWV